MSPRRTTFTPSMSDWTSKRVITSLLNFSRCRRWRGSRWLSIWKMSRQRSSAVIIYSRTSLISSRTPTSSSNFNTSDSSKRSPNYQSSQIRRPVCTREIAIILLESAQSCGTSKVSLFIRKTSGSSWGPVIPLLGKIFRRRPLWASKKWSNRRQMSSTTYSKSKTRSFSGPWQLIRAKRTLN